MITKDQVHIFCLFYGGYTDLHLRLAKSLEMAASHIGMTFWCNQVCEESLGALSKLRLPYCTLHVSEQNVPKYEAMSQMFRRFKGRQEPEEWVVWFDDDSWISQPGWFQYMAKFIAEGRDVCYIGQRWWVPWLAGQWDFVRSMPWFAHKPPDIIKGQPGVNFATGGYWWLRTDVLAKLDWPPVGSGLSHNGGDVLLAEAVRQQGFPFHRCDYGVRVNDAKRRGRHEAPVGCIDKSARR